MCLRSKIECENPPKIENKSFSNETGEWRLLSFNIILYIVVYGAIFHKTTIMMAYRQYMCVCVCV